MASKIISSVLVTGSNRGIGFELVKAFLEKANPPQHIFGTCRNPTGAQELNSLATKHSNLHIIQLDATNQESIKAAYKAVHDRLKGCGLNMIINNAGIFVGKNKELPNEERMIVTFKTNTIGPLIVTKEFLPLLKKAVQESPDEKMSCSKASVINISSELGSITNVPDMYSMFPAIDYRCSKVALNMLTRCQSESYKKDGILCVVIHPGWVQTDMGGPEAPVTEQECVTGIMGVFEKLTEKQSGSFLDWKGNTIPW
ncbi:Hypothetical predicted protein [Pelobates cultripes]|uniref:C-factor-like n=1 Tax=Pelobates cultripes TaxID=61616 RepID=A0AAD1WVR5_PELCU|nr:Hypothetical predicted protein [Pelobates cultripes]